MSLSPSEFFCISLHLQFFWKSFLSEPVFEMSYCFKPPIALYAFWKFLKTQHSWAWFNSPCIAFHVFFFLPYSHGTTDFSWIFHVPHTVSSCRLSFSLVCLPHPLFATILLTNISSKALEKYPSSQLFGDSHCAHPPCTSLLRIVKDVHHLGYNASPAAFII